MVLSENAVYRYTSNTSNIPPLPNENSHPPTTLIGQSPQVTIWMGQMTIAHQNGHFNREKWWINMDQPWINHGFWWFLETPISPSLPQGPVLMFCRTWQQGWTSRPMRLGLRSTGFYMGFQGKSTGKKHGFSHEKKGDSWQLSLPPIHWVSDLGLQTHSCGKFQGGEPILPR